ncbi:transposase [Psychrobacter sp. H8-1]|nr:transposase [Psychrobacter sp. H8-1]
MDESGFEHETIRSHGYAPIGKPCIDSYTGKVKSEPTLSVLYMKR